MTDPTLWFSLPLAKGTFSKVIKKVRFDDISSGGSAQLGFFHSPEGHFFHILIDLKNFDHF